MILQRTVPEEIVREFEAGMGVLALVDSRYNLGGLGVMIPMVMLWGMV